MIRGFDFIIGMSPEIRQYSATKEALFRPEGFWSETPRSRRQILFVWDDGLPHQSAGITFTGNRADPPETAKLKAFDDEDIQ
jgi:hypothetical protein